MLDLNLKPADPDGVGEGDNFWLFASEENSPEILLSIICTRCDYEGHIIEAEHRELCYRLAGGC